MAIEGTYFFRPPLNTAPAVFVDNRYDTSQTNTSLTVYIDANGDGTGAAEPFTHVFIKAKGTLPTNYTVVPAGGSANQKTVPATGALSDNLIDSSDESRSPVVNGFFHNLDEWVYSGGMATAKSLQFAFPGGGLDIVQLYVLRAELRIDQDGFSDIKWAPRYAGVEQVSARGRGSVAPGVAGNRRKHHISLTAEKNTHDDISRGLDALFETYPEFVFCMEWPRFPDQIFKAKNAGQTAEFSYRSQYKGRGRRATWTISEL